MASNKTNENKIKRKTTKKVTTKNNVTRKTTAKNHTSFLVFLAVPSLLCRYFSSLV